MRYYAESAAGLLTYGTYIGGQALEKATKIPAKISWSLLFLQEVSPALHALFPQTIALEGLTQIAQTVPGWLDIAAGGAVALNTLGKGAKNIVVRGLERQSKRHGGYF